MLGSIRFLSLLLMIVVPLFFLVVPLIDIVKNEFTGNNKLVWILVVIFVPVFGGMLYFIFGIGRNHQISK